MERMRLKDLPDTGSGHFLEGLAPGRYFSSSLRVVEEAVR